MPGSVTVQRSASATPEPSWCNCSGNPTHATVELLGRHDCVQFVEVVMMDARWESHEAWSTRAGWS